MTTLEREAIASDLEGMITNLALDIQHLPLRRSECDRWREFAALGRAITALAEAGEKGAIAR